MKPERFIPVDFSFEKLQGLDVTRVALRIDGLPLHSFTMTSLGDLQWIVENDLKHRGRRMMVFDELRIHSDLTIPETPL